MACSAWLMRVQWVAGSPFVSTEASNSHADPVVIDLVENATVDLREVYLVACCGFVKGEVLTALGHSTLPPLRP